MYQIKPIDLKLQNSFISDYRKVAEKPMNFFEYSPYESLEKRHDYLMNESFPRTQLASAIKKMHQKWDAPNHTYASIEQLTDPTSTVVIGGQQAGVLTGPLYSMNKLISIIKYAKEQSEKLQTPVLPVFWIAGEDHDFEEINHVFIQEKNSLRKHRIRQHVQEKATVSSIGLDHPLIGAWVDAVFTSLEETEHAGDIYQLIHRCLAASHTYVDFFARMVFSLLPNESFLLIDSADELTRKMQQPFFERLINNQQTIATSIYQTDVALNRAGYDSIVEVQPNDGHLFYHLNGERILLERDARNSWVGKQQEIVFTTDELLKVAQNTPELLSNNVMTRPLMQEMMFPTLAFIGGNGEITYWALLKEAFHTTGLQMPPVIPRLSFTYVDRKTGHALQELELDIGHVIEHGTDQDKMNFIRKQTSPPVDLLMHELKQQIQRAYEPLHDMAGDIRSDIGDLTKSNEQIVLKELSYVEKRMNKAIEEPVQHVLEQYTNVQMVLHPHNGLQERVWDPVPFLVEHGVDLFERVLEETYDFNQTHYVIYL